MAHDVFLSYSSEDKTVADAVCAGLESQGIRCWIAPRDVGPGKDWAATIVDAIQDCRIFVIILSSGSNKSSQVLREVERAVNAGKVVIPFRIEDLIPSKSLGYFLSVSHWLDALTEPLEKHIDELAVTISQLLQDNGAKADSEPPPARGIDSPSMLSRPEGQVHQTMRNQNRLYVIIAILLTIVVLGLGWFVFYEMNHKTPMDQMMDMDRGMGMNKNWNNWR